MKRLMAGTLACAASLAISAAAQAAPQNFFFSCPDADVAPVANTSKDTVPSWTATAPTAAIKDGAGCAEADPSVIVSTKPESQPSYEGDGVFGGRYAGEIKKFDFTLYGAATPLYDASIDVTLSVDGDVLVQAQLLTSKIEATAQTGIYKSSYSITGLNVPATKNPKQVILVVSNHYINSWQTWLEGSSEAPANASLFAFDDLTCDEQLEYDDTIVCPDE